MYGLENITINQSLESMQEIVLIHEIVALVKKPTLKSENFVMLGSGWIQVKNEQICSSIIDMMSDNIKHKMFSFLQTRSFTIPNLLKELDIPYTSGYRKISSLITDGLVVESRFIETKYYKCLYEYTSFIQSVKILVVDGETKIFIKLRTI